MKRFFVVLLVAVLSFCFFGQAFADVTRNVFISESGGSIYLRAEPDTSSKALGYIKHGAAVADTGERSGEWSKIRVPNGKTGWLKTKYIDGSMASGAVSGDDSSKEYALKIDGNIYLREGPGKEYGVNGTVKTNMRVTVSEVSGEWAHIRVKDDGRVGWVKTKYIPGFTGGAAGSTASVPEVSSGAHYAWHVTATDLNIRTEPSASSSIVKNLKTDAAMVVFGEKNGWYSVGQFDKPLGYVSAKYVAPGGLVKVGSKVTVYVSPDSSSSKIDVLSGNNVTLDCITGEWARIAFDGNIGYVRVSDITSVK